MNKETFLARLDELLRDMPDTERKEAIEYYREYFDDAGVENEQQVLQEIGSVEEIAQNIREELAGKEVVLWNRPAQESGGQNAKKSDDGKDTQYRKEDFQKEETEKNTKRNPLVTGVLIVLLILLVILVGIPVFSSGIGVILTLIAIFFVIALAVCICSVVFFVLSVCFLVLSVLNCVASPIVGLMFIGAAILFFGLGILFMLLSSRFFSVVIPASVRGMAALIRKLFIRKEVYAS